MNEFTVSTLSRVNLKMVWMEERSMDWSVEGRLLMALQLPGNDDGLSLDKPMDLISTCNYRYFASLTYGPAVYVFQQFPFAAESSVEDSAVAGAVALAAAG